MLHLKGSCDEAARAALVDFHHHNLAAIDEDTDSRARRERQWAALLSRVDELAAQNRNGRIFAETVHQAIGECWSLPIVSAPAAAPQPPTSASAPVAGDALEADVAGELEPPIASAASCPAIMLCCEEGEYTVSIETLYGWVDVIRDRGPIVSHIAEPAYIAECVNRAAELAAAAIMPNPEEGQS
jgi:hypothetical protein